MRQRNSDIFLVMGIAALNIVVAFLPMHLPLVNTVLALPLIFFSTGYVLIEMITLRRTLGTFHRIIFSLGVSITLDIMAGFLLNALPVGLHTESWVIVLGGITLLLGMFVPLLRVGTDVSRPGGVSYSDKSVVMPFKQIVGIHPLWASVESPDKNFQSHNWSVLRGGAVFSLAIILVVVALIYATNGVTQQPHTGFTQLWMLPPTPSEQSCIVHLGVRSFEMTPVTYSATLSVNTIREVTWPSIALAPNQTWDQPIQVPATSQYTATIEVKLYKGVSSTSVYRQVHITLHFNQAHRCV